MELLVALGLVCLSFGGIWWVGRGLYRRVFFDSIVARHTRNQGSKPVQAMTAALEENAQAEFAELANNASMNDLRELKNRGDVADHPGRVAVFPGYAKNHPNDARAQYLNGCYLVRKAWAARGSGTTDTLSDSDVEKFHGQLSDGQAALRGSIELDPNMPDAYAEMLIVIRGAGSEAEAGNLFDEARNRFPNDIQLHQNMLLLLTARWMGSDETVLEFARNYGNSDSTGNLTCLIPFAHLEIWYGSDSEIVTYFKDKNIRREIKAAFKQFIVSSDDGQQSQGRLDGLQYFACAFGMMGDNKNGKKAFKKMRGGYSSAAWRMWEDPEVLFTKAKLAVT